MIVRHLVAGASVQEAARRAEISVNIVRRWKSEDEEFNRLLQDTEERAVNAIIDEGVDHVLQQVKELGPTALEVLKDALGSHDERLRLQAAQSVFRIGGVGKQAAAAKPGLEAEIAALGNKTRPQDGD
jgi:hypothetical protein